MYMHAGISAPRMDVQQITLLTKRFIIRGWFGNMSSESKLAETEAWIFYKHKQKGFVLFFLSQQAVCSKIRHQHYFFKSVTAWKKQRLKWKFSNNSIKICFPVGAWIRKCSIMCLKEHKGSAEGSAAGEVFCSWKDKSVNNNFGILQHQNLGWKSSFRGGFSALADTHIPKKREKWLKQTSGVTMTWEDIVLSSFSSPFLFVGLALLHLSLLKSNKASRVRYTSRTSKHKSRMCISRMIPRSCLKKERKQTKKRMIAGMFLFCSFHW